MNYLGGFETQDRLIDEVIELKNLQKGINTTENLIVKIHEDRAVDYVIDKICDHSGGKLIVKENKAVCPLHEWKLNLNTLKYENDIKKNQLEYQIRNEDTLVVTIISQKLYNPFLNNKKEGSFTLRWLNHACIYIECNGVSLITDPWLFGPAFLTGWWLDKPSPVDALELLKDVDFVYISHNHPDHLHPETLNLLPRDVPILVADFHSKSTENYLKNLVFTNIIPFKFNEVWELISGFQISILKSGDFRDDSGIYLNLNGHQVLLTVDCNFLNSYNLPENLDLLLTSYAGGASGFPLCFDNYSIDEKKRIVKRNKFAMRNTILKYIETCRPKYYMPYAGMFKEYAKRDKFIAQYNAKNSLQDIKDLLSKSEAQFLSPDFSNAIRFTNGILKIIPFNIKYLANDSPNYYLNKLKEEFVYDSDQLISYLKASGYKGKQIVQIIPTNDDFIHIGDSIVCADFDLQDFKVIDNQCLIKSHPQKRVMQLYIRSEILANVVKNMLPWEDFAIGFQMRVKREPNSYEADFWYHFTNNYIKKHHLRYASYCGACTALEQNPKLNRPGSNSHKN